MAAPLDNRWTDEDEQDIVRTERALDRLRYATPRSKGHADTIRMQIQSCVDGLKRMRALRDELLGRAA